MKQQTAKKAKSMTVIVPVTFILAIVLLVVAWLTRHIWMDKKYLGIYTIVGGIALGATVIACYAIDKQAERKQMTELENQIEDMTRRLDRIIQKLPERELEEKKQIQAEPQS